MGIATQDDFQNVLDNPPYLCGKFGPFRIANLKRSMTTGGNRMAVIHNFFSDTKTRPSRAMREAMLDAPVGDEQAGEDPTTLALEQRVAELLGKEAAVFLPSGTMCNEIAIRIHTRPGDEVICERASHIIIAEGGGPAAFSGVMIHPLDGRNGVFQPEQVQAAIHAPSRYAPRSRLLCIEQTANFGGGAVWPLETVRAVAAVAKGAGLATHIDGARLMNAVVKSGVAARDWCADYDSCWIDFSKGLGAPVGAALAGSREFIEEAWRIKQQIGGAMRQSGVLAAMCLYALDHNIERLAEDHRLAKRIADHIAALPKVASVLPADTNIVIFHLTPDAPPAPAVAASLAEDGVIVGAFGDRMIRVVTHLDVDDTGAAVLCDRLTRNLG
jgi:threonine aldolase